MMDPDAISKSSTLMHQSILKRSTGISDAVSSLKTTSENRGDKKEDLFLKNEYSSKSIKKVKI